MMKGKSRVLEIDKCVVSRLWYTTLNVLLNEIHSLSENYTRDDIIQIISTIQNETYSKTHDYDCWIIWKIFHILGVNSLCEKPEHIEFILALKFLTEEIPKDVEEEIVELFKNVSDSKSVKTNVAEISEDCLKFLEFSLGKYPSIASRVIKNLLCVWSEFFSDTDTQIQHLCLKCLRKFLPEFNNDDEDNRISLFINKEREDKNKGSTIHPEFKKTRLDTSRFDYDATLLSILSKLEFTDDENEKLINWLFPALFNTFENKDVAIALYTRRSNEYFNKWLIFIDKILLRNEIPNSKEHSFAISNAILIVDDKQVHINCNELIQRTIKLSRHWLIDILDIIYALLATGNAENVSTLLSVPILRPLWPIAFFNVLKNLITHSENVFGSDEDVSSNLSYAVRFVLDKSQPFFIGGEDNEEKEEAKEIWHHLRSEVENQLDIIDWVLKNKTDKESGKKDLTIKKIFYLLTNNGILATLNSATNIHEGNFTEIENLLKNCGESTMATFKAYRSMLCALKAVLLSDLYSSRSEDVGKYLTEMENILRDIYPLSIRIETMENIFSMIFLRHEDFFNRNNYDEEESGETESENDKNDGDIEVKKIHDGMLIKRTKSGFICNKCVLRDLLLSLKLSILDTRIRVVDKTLESEALANLSRALDDAIWRLKLLTSSAFVENIGNAEGRASNNKKEFNFCNNLSTNKLIASKIQFLNNRSVFYQQDDSSSSEDYNKSEIDISSDPGSNENYNYSYNSGSRRTKFLRKSNNSVGEKSVNLNYSSNSFILNFMLSSKESLVVQFLWRCDFDKAQQVIQMFDSADTQLDAEVRFSKAISQFRQRIKENVEVLSPARHAETTNSEISTLQNIRQAVQEGIQRSRLTGQLETFLASNESTLRLLNPEEINTNEILTMTVLDLALTTGDSRSCSLNACEVAKKYLKSFKITEKSTYSSFFYKISKLFYESKVDVPLPDILCDASIPLSIQKFNENIGFWYEVERVIRIFNSARLNRGGKSVENINNFNQREKKAMNLLRDYSNGEIYLDKIFAHLNILGDLLPEKILDPNFDASPFLMLELPIQSYFGHQFFDLGVKPDELEVVAKKLGVNLVHSILVTCCPKFTFYDKIDNIRRENKLGYIILNENSQDKLSTEYDMEKPVECVSQILSELLKTVENIFPNKSLLSYQEIQNLSSNNEILDILGKTNCLKNLNLCELSAGNETLTFFLNLWNLMFLHSLIIIWSENLPCNKLQHAVSTLKISYLIGDLGLVTLAALRSKLLGNLAWDLEFFKLIEDVNEVAWQDLDLDQDPRVIFTMANEFYGTPAVCVYDAENLDKVLNKAIGSYISCYNLIAESKNRDNDTEIDVCWLPEAVCRYQDFLLENASLARQNYDSNFEESFVLRKFLNASDKSVEFKYRMQIYQYEMKLNYSEDKSGARNGLEITRRYSNTNINNIRKSKIDIEDRLLQYFEEHCWLLSYLVQKIHMEKSPRDFAKACENAGRCLCLENLLNATWTQILKNTFDENKAFVGMHENVSPREIWTYFESLIKKEKWKHCLSVLNAMPDNLTVNNPQISTLKDKVLGVLISGQIPEEDTEVIKLLRQIRNIDLLAQTILSNLKRWSLETSESALTYLSNHLESSELPPNSKLQMNSSLCRVNAFRRMKNHLENNTETKNITWYGIASPTNKSESLKIAKSLIDANKFELCFEWLKLHTLSTEIQALVTKDLLIGLMENERQDFGPAKKLLEALPLNRSIKLSARVLKRLESVPAIKFLTSYLLDHCKPTEAVRYHKILFSVEILSRLEFRERSAFIHLLKHPLLMLEQLLMNGKFEILNKILSSQSLLDNFSKASISREDMDKIVRYYAEKSLEFRVALQRDGIESKYRDSASLNTENESAEFIMPIKVPTKEEWVPNDKSRVCSCCKSVVFSMFNRRHHCRRCGRVVCAVCSQQRMRVPTYPDSVHVRVCDDCKRQSILRTRLQQGAPSTPSSETFDYWRLTTDKTHNQTLKDEFSFEHAPSISLCLAILNLHSDHKAYASFLLDRCDEIKQLLRPVASGLVNPEVDHKLLVKMIRSLTVAAKVKCAKLSLNAGLDNCDRMLSHVDLLATLVQSDCSELVPSDKLDDHALRRLRDLLTEKEQWILALDVSTKSGLDRQGVWAAWGKAYLKVGCYDQAREKFSHCLEKVSTNGFEDWVFLPNFNQPEIEKIKKNDRQMDRTSRPAKNPPLLNEILQIIEASNFNRQSRKVTGFSRGFIAHDISLTLNNINAISQGRYYEVETSFSKTDNSYYYESLHYLISYGSHFAILEFFIKHDKFDDCLTHIIENKVDQDTFFNGVYLPCLKNGCVEKLHEAMRARDGSLSMWKNYLIFTCHSLECKKYSNTLYQLQIFAKDYIRASMSCIKFYINGSNNYTELCNRSKFLNQAQKHLETELQAQSSFGSKRRKSVSSQNSAQSSSLNLELEISDIDRHINTISRQMEIAKFLKNSEQEGRNVEKYLNDLYNMENDSYKNYYQHELPTLFGTQLQKTQLAVLAIICGRDVEEGFGIAFRIIQDYNLRSEKVYSLAGHILASEGKIASVEQLVKCCRSSGAADTNALSDRVLAHCVKLVLNSSQIDQQSGSSSSDSSSKDKVDSLIRLINDLELKISMCIESRQLKSAYLLAVRHSRVQDVRKIYKEADRLEQNAIKSICAKWLQRTQKS